MIEMAEKKGDYKIKDSGERTQFSTGAVRDLQSGKGRFDLIPMATLRALAIHYERGCLKYGDRNWEKGITVHTYLNSAIRHAAQVIDGQNDENHLISAIWNLFCAYETILRIQDGKLPADLYDLPNKIVLPSPYGQKEIAAVVSEQDWSKIPTLNELEKTIKKSKKSI